MAIKFSSQTKNNRLQEDWHKVYYNGREPGENYPPKPKRGRPSNGFDKLAYNRQFMADKRSATKLGISVKEFRAAKHHRSQAK